MPQYIGFCTAGACKPRSTNPIPQNGVATAGSGTGTIGQPVVWGKKFRLLDEQLVVQDFVNALNIPYGQKVGQPGFGTTLWDFIFEPNTADVQFQLETEIRRVAARDPRLDINYIKAFPYDNGILVETQVSVVPFNNPAVLNVYFNQQTGTAALQ